MSGERRGALMWLLGLTAFALLVLGERAFTSERWLPNGFEIGYGFAAAAFLGWLAYFGSKP